MQHRQLEHWLTAACDGDREALAQLYAHTRINVYGYALSLLARSQDAQDVTQETYLSILGARYTPQGTPMAWLLTITKNLALMQLRKSQPVELDESLAAETPPPESLTVDRMVLHTALTALSQQERQIVLLSSLGGVKLREIAVLLDLGLSTVLSKRRRALKKLQQLLKEESL